MEPHIEDGINNGHIVIDIVKDANAKNWPTIILDINNISIKHDLGKTWIIRIQCIKLQLQFKFFFQYQ